MKKKKSRKRTWAYKKERDLYEIYPNKAKVKKLIERRMKSGWWKKDRHIHRGQAETSKLVTRARRADRSRQNKQAG
jgi:hypothetical protein